MKKRKFKKPNAVTLAAMKDAKEGIGLTPVDTSSLEALKESLST